MQTLRRILTSVVFVTLMVTRVYSQGDLNFQPIALPEPTERVTGIYCESATACVISTDGTGGVGHIYASDGQTITATLITGDSAFSEPLGTLGGVDFMGFTKVGEHLIAHVEKAGSAFVSATGDITQASSWKAVMIGTGTADDPNGFGLNMQMGFGVRDNRWLYFSHLKTYETTDTPGPSALWQPVWSNTFQDLYSADPNLCAAEPGVSITPKLTQPAYVAPDLAIILYPAGSRNQGTEVSPGVCISTDGGKLYYHVPFAELSGDLGPVGVSCISANQCFAYGGLEYEAESVYVYYTQDAQKGVDSSWTRSSLPTTRDNTRFRGIAFSPDNLKGWLVGADGSSSPLLMTSSDGGASWTDSTSLIRELSAGIRLHTVYAFDENHIWIGGEDGLLLNSGY